MAYRLILDENVEHEVLHRLENYGHDVEHIDFTAELGKGIDDRPIARYSRKTDRIIVTYDDFALEFDDATLSAKQVADVIHRVSQVYARTDRGSRIRRHGVAVVGASRRHHAPRLHFWRKRPR